MRVAFHQTRPHEILLSGDFRQIKKKQRRSVEQMLERIPGFMGVNFTSGESGYSAFAYNPKHTSEEAIRSAAAVVLGDVPFSVATTWTFDLQLGLPCGDWINTAAPRLETIGVEIFRYWEDSNTTLFYAESTSPPGDALARRIASVLS